MITESENAAKTKLCFRPSEIMPTLFCFSGFSKYWHIPAVVLINDTVFHCTHSEVPLSWYIIGIFVVR